MAYAPAGAHHQTFQHQHSAHRGGGSQQLVQDIHQPVLMPHQILQQPHPSAYGAAHVQVPSYPARRSSKRPRPEDDDGDEGEERGLGLHLQMLPPELHSQDTEQSPLLLSAHSDRSHHGLSSSTFQLPAVQQQHHHHRLPTQATPSKVQRTGAEMTSPGMQSGPPSVVGQAGMPDPAPRPRGPKLKFTQEEDALLVDLKENKNLTWKQIADFFPGRTSGTLQVRYCTKLKAKTTTWTDETVQRLRNAIQEYENDRWRHIAAKVGSGFSPAACREKAAELAELQ